jgi:hypothetical protein
MIYRNPGTDLALSMTKTRLFLSVIFNLVAFSNRPRAHKLIDHSLSMVMTFAEIMGEYMQGSESHDHPDP